MGVSQCKDIGVMCGCVTGDTAEGANEMPIYGGLSYSTSQAHPSPFSPPEGQPYVGAHSSYDDSYTGIPPSPPGGYEAPAGGSGLSFDAILSNLEAAEAKAYEGAFNSFAGGGPVPLDNDQCRGFLMANGSFDDLEMDLLTVATENMTLDLSGFLRILRLRPISDQDIYGQFSAFSSDGTSLASEECRTGLTLMCQDRLAATFDDERWDCILTMVMMDAPPSVSIDEWMLYAKSVARYVRLIQYCGC